MPSLANLRVPDRHLAVLSALAKLTGDVWDDAVDRLPSDDAPPASSRDVTEPLSEALASSDVDAETLLAVAVSMHSLHSTHGWAYGPLAEHVSASEKLELTAEERDLLAQRLGALLSASSLATLAKALDLAGERLHLLHTSRIVTDVRPIFGDDPSEPPTGVIATHTLRMEYYDTDMGRLRSFEVTLSGRDLELLSGVAERARVEEQTMRTYLGSVGLPVIEPEVGD